MTETRRVEVEFLAGPLDGWVSTLTTDQAPDLPEEWWPRTVRPCGFYELSLSSHRSNDLYTYRWHEAGRG